MTNFVSLLVVKSLHAVIHPLGKPPSEQAENEEAKNESNVQEFNDRQSDTEELR